MKQETNQLVTRGMPWMMSAEHLPRYLRQDRVSMAQQPQQGSYFDEYLKRAEKIEPEMQGDTAIIQICGPIEYKLSLGGWFYGATATRAVEQAFQKCVDDQEVARIVMLLDTPGGDPTGVAECTKRIFEQRESKPIVAIVDPLCASAGLWFACAAGRVSILQSGWIGWLGTINFIQSWSEAYKMSGIEERVICNPPQKGEWVESQPISESYQAWMQGVVDEYTKQFVSTIAKYRGVSTSHVNEKFGQGRGLMAKQAKEAGLVDDLIPSVAGALSKGRRQSKSQAKNNLAALKACV